MTKPLRVDSRAEAELAAAFDRYERRRPGLGLEVLGAVDEALASLCRSPEAAVLVRRGAPPGVEVREAHVRRFPYRVVFLDLPDHVWVVAFAHVRRRPGYWRDRVTP